MGLFKSKAQKEAEAKIRQQEDLTRQMSDRLDPKSDAVPYRSEKKNRQAQQEASRKLEGIRDEIDESLRRLANEINVSLEDAEDDAQEVRDLERRIRRMELNNNVGVNNTILVFVRNQIQTAITNIHQKNVTSVFAFTNQIDGLLSEMEDPQSAKLFSDPQYLQQRMRVAELAAAKEKLVAQRIREQKQKDKIKAAMDKGRISQRDALAAVDPIRTRVADLDRQIKNIENDLGAAQTALLEVQTLTLNKIQDRYKDVDTFNQIADQKADVDALTAERNDAVNRLRADNSDVTADEMNFHAEHKQELTKEQIDNAFDF